MSIFRKFLSLPGNSTKQLNNNLTNFFFVFLMTNRKGAKFCFSLPVGRNKIVHQENNNILGENIVSLFSCFVNTFLYIFN